MATSPCYSFIMSDLNESEGEPIFTIFPNPFADKLFINFGKSYRNIEMTVEDIKGGIILKEGGNNQNNAIINMERFGNGIYFLHLSVENNEMIYRVLKEQQ